VPTPSPASGARFFDWNGDAPALRAFYPQLRQRNGVRATG
jgi:hypothetical protein